MTEHRPVRSRLNASSQCEMRYRDVCRQADLFIGILDTEGTVQEMNRAALETIGAALGDVTGTSLWDVFGYGQTTKIGKNLRAAIHSASYGAVSSMSISLRTALNEGRKIELTIKPVSEGEKAPRGLVVEGRVVDCRVEELTAELKRQITERRKLERALRKAEADLERLAAENSRDLQAQIAERERIERQFIQAQKMEAVGQLTGGISHDFNNLLTIILGNLDWLKERLTDDEKSSHLADEAIKAAHRGADLTQRLLTFSRKQDLWPEHVDLPDLIARFQPLLTRALRESIALEQEFESGLWPVFVDPGQLENAVMNLGINARDAMPDGGTLRIKARNFSAGKSFAAKRPGMAVGDYVVLSIQDTGSGMTQEVLQRACDPFFTTKETGRGSGLGLSMVFGFARQSGGVVEMDSEVGCGTSIHLYLPRAEGVIAETDNPDKEITAVGGTEAVLVVEDDPMVRELVLDYLSDLGYRTSNAETAHGALGVLEKGIEIDLVLTDVVMPGGMSGIDLSDAVSSHYSHVKVLHMSGYSPEEFHKDGLPAEGFAMLQKPFTKDELASMVRNVLDA